MNNEHIPVFFEGHDDLIEILATSMASICYNTKSFIDFYILDCGICNFNKRQLESMKDTFLNFSLEFITIDLKQFEGLKGWGKGNFLDCYARLLIPELKPEIDKAVYLDTDVIALDDIQKLYDIHLGDFPYGASPELGYSKELFTNCIQNLGISNKHIYPNAGVLLINCKKWRMENAREKLISTARKYKNYLIVLNEEILSITFGLNNYKKLDLRFNISDRLNEVKEINAPEITDEYIFNEWKNAVLQHITPTKIWIFLRNDRGQPARNASNFWKFAAMTPYYEGLQNKYLWFTSEATRSLIPFPSIPSAPIKEKILLFGLPLFTVKRSDSYIRYKLFGFIPMLKIKVK